MNRARDVALTLDDTTGCPTSLRSGDVELDLAVTLDLVVGGVEERGVQGGLHYRDTTTLTGTTATAPARRRSTGLDDQVVVTTDLQGWTVEWTWTLHPSEGPALGLGLTLTPPTTGERVLRDLIVRVTPQLPYDAVVHVPGAQLRPSLEVRDLPAVVQVASAGGVPGSSALFGFETEGATMVAWPFCRTELGSITLSPVTGGCEVTYATSLAGEVAADESLVIEPLLLHLAPHTGWDHLLALLPQWYAGLALTTPQSPPPWLRAASIFEVQLGTSLFWGGHSYTAYPDVAALRADLDRVQQLGFDVIQLMPRQPYPSYNLHEVGDVDTSYAPADELRALVDDCHARGMHIILDILMHGVLDNESIDEAAVGVRGGPLAASLETLRGQAFDEEGVFYPVAWSRHILDFEQAWKQGSPVHHHLLDEHPDWFFRASDGHVTGIYTKALDARTGFADAFIDACCAMVQTLGIDGFRFDAPTYNDFPNWSPETRHRASASQLACTSLFRRLRPRLRAIRDDVLLYTEPSGVLLRESMDLNYNYDEQWLLASIVLDSEHGSAHQVRTGHDLVAWYHDRDAALPPGSLTAHHIDSHDTFWWPLWGDKWRREQFGLPATRAIATVNLLLGSPYMMFVGGEVGLEDWLPVVNRLKREHAALREGRPDFVVLAPDAPSVFSVLHHHADEPVAVLVNLSDRPATSRVVLPVAGPWHEVTGQDGLPSQVTDGDEVTLPAWGAMVLAGS
ncbi:alpha-amylase family glycosyl hydrolase [Aestuariimicrobium kwangyangense]|uniref:alpha-amylase family glycosyl hydrolase n=1 Tax=Aestuariimicrobium kwangyangense TaxID=396389 RepID=UPI001FDF279B|nr:alpha-amylase family glycosyl hydrolase [Aestuariimicrobium kwangyangense]